MVQGSSRKARALMWVGAYRAVAMTVMVTAASSKVIGTVRRGVVSHMPACRRPVVAQATPCPVWWGLGSVVMSSRVPSEVRCPVRIRTRSDSYRF